MELGHGLQIDVAVDAAEAEEVLILQIAAVAPAVALHGKQVFFARLDVGGDVKLGIVVCALAIAHLLAVHPDVDGAVGTVEVEQHGLVLPLGGEGEGASVRTHGVRFGHVREAVLALDEGRVVAEGVGDVAVDGGAVAQHLPVGWDGNLVPAAVVERGLEEVRRAFVGTFHPVELPVAVEQHVARRGCALPGLAVGRVALHLAAAGEGDEGAVAVEFVDGEDLFVLPVVLRDGARLQFEACRFDNPLLFLVVTGGDALHGGFPGSLFGSSAEGEASCQTDEGIAAVVKLAHLPQLVEVAEFCAPLDDVALTAALVAVVNAHVVEGRDDVDGAATAIRKAPDLRLAFLVGRGEDDVCIGVEAAAVVQHKSCAGVADDVVLFGLEFLGGQTRHSQDEECDEAQEGEDSAFHKNDNG